MPAFDPVSLGVQGAIGAAETAVGLINAGKARKEAKQLQRSRPKYAIPADAARELSLSESELGTGGLSARAESAYSQLNNRQFSSSLDALLRGGGSPNQVSDVFDSSEAGRLRLAQLNDEMRLQKINNLISSRRYMNEQKDKQFEFNEWMPWSDAAQANAQARQNAENMTWAGLGQLGAAGINAGTQAFNSKMWGKYFNQGKSGTPTPPPSGAYPGGSNVKPPYEFGQWSPGGLYWQDEQLMQQMPKGLYDQ